MSFSAILLISLALAVDAFAVALATGVKLRYVDQRQTFRLSFHFGLFQGMMTIIGWASGLTFRPLIESVDHWIAFTLLTLIALHMLFEVCQTEEEDQRPCDPTRGKTMVMLSVATSIDALAVGLSLSMINISIWLPAAIIALTALLLTAAGLHIGKVAGSTAKLGKGAEILGSIILLGIGIKILHEHGVF